MNNQTESRKHATGYKTAHRQWRKCHRILEALELERQLSLISPSEYAITHRSLLQAVDELETLLRTQQETLPKTPQLEG